MDSDTLALLIPIMALSIPLSWMWVRHREKIAEIEAGASAGAVAEQPPRDSDREHRLEERLRVLERIVTDSGYRLSGEIDRLRGDRESVE